jgi:fumarate reductase (CoM/CoB) subunit A
MLTTHHCDVLVIGGGGAGALAAIHAAKRGADVLLVEKGVFGKSGNTILGGYSCNAALGVADERDNPRVHFEDTIREGKFLGDQTLVDVYTREAPDRIYELYEYGARFEKVNDRFAQGVMPGSTYPRACFIDDRTGQALMAALRRETCHQENVRIHHETIVTRLLLEHESVVGAAALRLRDCQPVCYSAKATVIATGGGSQLYQYSTTSIDNTGDGLVLAFDAGAQLQDVEFVQFYPTVQCYPRLLGLNPTAPAGLRIQAQARIYNAEGQDFVEERIPDWQLKATRDILSQVIYQEIMEGRGTPHGGVFIDVSHLPPEDVEREFAFSGFFDKLLAMGIDLRREPIETGVAAHYFMGGISVDERCETAVSGLFAAGEAMAGVDGANRLGGNALSEILVFGARAGNFAAEYASRAPAHPLLRDVEFLEPLPRHQKMSEESIRPVHLKRALQYIMWEKVGVIRDGARLQEARQELKEIERKQLGRLVRQSSLEVYNREILDSIEVRKMVILAQIVASTAQMRQETRGAHARLDFPRRDDQNWLVNLVVRKEEGGFSISKEPVRLDQLQLEER